LNKQGDFFNEINLTIDGQNDYFCIAKQTMVSIFDNMTQVTEAEVRQMLPLVDEQRRNEALRYKHLFGQFACLKSWLMLKELFMPLGIKDLKMDYNEHGKPFLSHYPNVFFNLSHCKNGIAVAVDFSPVGIDIESFRKSNLSLINKTMNPTEAEWIRASSEPVEAFTQYWTKKEAVVKLRGTGLVDDLHHILDGEGYRLETHINREKRYAFSIAFSHDL
jgi:4'-phosphopantetheinyl transferase